MTKKIILFLIFIQYLKDSERSPSVKNHVEYALLMVGGMESA